MLIYHRFINIPLILFIYNKLQCFHGPITLGAKNYDMYNVLYVYIKCIIKTVTKNIRIPELLYFRRAMATFCMLCLCSHNGNGTLFSYLFPTYFGNPSGGLAEEFGECGEKITLSLDLQLPEGNNHF